MLNRFFTLGKSINKIASFSRKNALGVVNEHFIKDHCKCLFKKWIDSVPDNLASHYYDKIVNDFGFEVTLYSLIELYFSDPLNFSNKFYHCSLKFFKNAKKIKNIAIYTDDINIGGVFTIIKMMFKIFDANDYNVYIFTQRIKDGIKIPDNMNIVILDINYNNIESLKSHSYSFYKELLKNRIDLVIHTRCASSTLLWHIVSCHKAAIPIVLSSHNNYAALYTQIYNKYPISINESIWRCLPAMLCLSIYAELYYRVRRINALYLPNPVKIPVEQNTNKNTNNIVIMGRISDKAKGLLYSVAVMQKVVKSIPDAKLYVIGQFNKPEMEKNFHDAVINANLQDNIIVTGWTDNPDSILANCSILLSLSYIEAFPMNIAEGLAMGLPCVIFDVPTMLNRNNPAIISVPQGDTDMAADEIIKLLNDKPRLKELGEMGKVFISQFSPELFEKNLLQFLENFIRLSPTRIYSFKDYQTTLRVAAYYAGNPKPA